MWFGILIELRLLISPIIRIPIYVESQMMHHNLAIINCSVSYSKKGFCDFGDRVLAKTYPQFRKKAQQMAKEIVINFHPLLRPRDQKRSLKRRAKRKKRRRSWKKRKIEGRKRAKRIKIRLKMMTTKPWICQGNLVIFSSFYNSTQQWKA